MPKCEPNCFEDMTSTLKVKGLKIASINVASLLLHIEELRLKKTADVRINGMASCDILSSFLAVCLNFIVNKDYSSHM